MSTNRLESFSDGVLAVAITLLVLNIQVPNPSRTAHLASALAGQWPQYVAYATSFLTIGIIWVNHHAMISRLRATDHSILMLNLILLLTIGVIPFATALLATYLREGHGANLAASVYGGAFLLMSVAFATLLWQTLFPKAHLLHGNPSREAGARSCCGASAASAPTSSRRPWPSSPPTRR